jgi:hypothetical protein
MSVTLLAAGAAAGAAGGLGGGLMKKGPTTVTPKFAEEQKPFLHAAQMSIPLYLQTITGGMPEYLKRYLAQTRGQVARASQQSIQNFMRQAGMRGGSDFGPAMMAQLGQIYGQQPQILAQQLGQTRAGLMGQALQSMNQWSQITPQGSETKTKQPSLGKMAAGGALQGISGALGQRMSGGAPAAASSGPAGYRSGVQNQQLAPQMQGPVRQSVSNREALQRAQFLNSQVAGMSPFNIGIR